MKDIREYAAGYLNIKPRTEKQLIRYLTGKGFDEKDAEDVAGEFREYHYIDDMDYSVMYFQYGFEKGRGIIRIKRELAERGVGSEIIEAAYDKMIEMGEIPDQYKAALSIAHGMTGGICMQELEYDIRRKLQAKVARKLVSRGFSQDIVYRVIKNL